MAHEATKRCTGCRKTKPEDAFSWANKARGYRNPKCRDCRSLASRRWYDDNRDWKLAQNMRWYNENREAHIKRAMANRDPEKHRISQAKRRGNGLYRNSPDKMSPAYRQLLEVTPWVCWIC